MDCCDKTQCLDRYWTVGGQTGGDFTARFSCLSARHHPPPQSLAYRPHHARVRHHPPFIVRRIEEPPPPRERFCRAPHTGGFVQYFPRGIYEEASCGRPCRGCGGHRRRPGHCQGRVRSGRSSRTGRPLPPESRRACRRRDARRTSGGRQFLSRPGLLGWPPLLAAALSPPWRLALPLSFTR